MSSLSTIHLGPAAKVASRTSSTRYAQSPTQAELSASGLQGTGAYSDEQWDVPEKLLSDFIATQLAAGSISGRQLVTVSASSSGNGSLWNVSVHIEPLEQQASVSGGSSSGGSSGEGGESGDSPFTPSDEEMQEKYGSEENPIELSITTQISEVSILLHPDYTALPAEKRTAIAYYLNGANPLQKVTISGSVKTLESVLPQRDALVQRALATPKFQSQNTVAQYGFWLLTRKTYSGSYPKKVNPPFGRLLPAGYNCYLIAPGSTEATEKGWHHKETYITGIIPLELTDTTPAS